jgi:hypothetical protein
MKNGCEWHLYLSLFVDDIKRTIGTRFLKFGMEIYHKHKYFTLFINLQLILRSEA